MHRSGKHENRSRKQRPDYAVQNWQDNDYSSRYPDNRYLQSEYNNKQENYYGDHYRYHKNYEQEDDPEDYESYTYEYNKRTYLRSPKSGDDIGKTYSREDKLKARKQHSAELQQRNNENFYKEDPTRRLSKYPSDGLHPNDRDVLDHAATKIQSVYRGYQARKDFWKKRENQRRRESLAIARQPRIDSRTDDYTYASGTSIVDGGSSSSLTSNIDPNLGITAPLPTLDSLQKHQILRELKNTVTYSEDIATVTHLQNETSPVLLTLGGINPPQSKDYVLGGAMFVYSMQKDKWCFGGTMPEPRNYHSAVYFNGKVYVTGGYNPLQISQNQMVATSTVYQLSVRSKRWRKRADMHQSRACHGMCIINDHIMVVGGRDASGKLLSTAELYYPKRDQWVLLKPMPEAVMGMACSVLDGCIFVIGGVVNEGNNGRYSISNRVYAFDFEKQTWYRQPQLPEGRAYSSATTVRREIWLWCGVKDVLNEDGLLMSTNTVMVYNPEFSKWELHVTIGTAKHSAALAKFGRRIYLLGGMSNVSGSKEVLNENDYYNRETDKYMEGASLPRPVTGLAVVALPMDYTPSSASKWNVETVDDDILNEAATKIQSVYRGYKCRSILSNDRQPMPSDAVSKQSYMNVYSMHTTTEPFADKWKMFQKVQIDEWPPVPGLQVSNSDVNLRFGTLPRGYTVVTSHSRTKVRRYVSLPPHVDPNLSMIGHLCNVYKRAKKILGLRKVERLPSFAANLITAHTLQDDSIPMILIIGGLQPKDPINLSYGKLILRYHTLKNRFEYFGALPEPRNYHSAVYYQENIYVTGGCDPDKRNSGEMVATSTTFCLNIHSSEWIEKADMNCSRAYHSLVVAMDKIFAIGGRDNNGRLVASIEAYDVETDQWTLLRPMTHPRMGMACVVVDDHIWCMGGIGVSEDSESLNYPVLSSVVSYDIGKDIWISRPPLRCPRAFGTCVMVSDSMWLVGGASKDRSNSSLISMGSTDKYIPGEAQWYRKTIISNPRHAAAVVAIDTCIYVFGGVSSQEWSPLARNEMIVTDDISLHTCEELPVSLTGIAAVAIPPVVPSLRSESLAILLHTKLSYH